MQLILLTHLLSFRFWLFHVFIISVIVYYCTHTHTHTHTQTHKHSHTNTHTHTPTHTHIQSHTHTQIHTHTSTQTHSHKHNLYIYVLYINICYICFVYCFVSCIVLYPSNESYYARIFSVSFVNLVFILPSLIIVDVYCVSIKVIILNDRTHSFIPTFIYSFIYSFIHSLEI